MEADDGADPSPAESKSAVLPLHQSAWFPNNDRDVGRVSLFVASVHKQKSRFVVLHKAFPC